MIKRLVIRTLVLIVVFVATVFMVNQLDNAGMDVVTAEMDQPTLPLLYMQFNSRDINCLHGYTSLIDTALFHDSITPVGTDQQVHFRFEDMQVPIESVSYELRDAKNQSLVENGVVDELGNREGAFYADTTLRMPLTAGTEYGYTIILKEENGREIRYYTRLITADSGKIVEFLDFATHFHEATFNKEDQAAVAQYIEPNEQGNNENLAHSSIHSNYETDTWANLSVMRISQLTPTIKELDLENMSVEFSYVAISGDVENSQYFNVTEEYRMKRTEDNKIYLMDYDRYVENIFDRFNVNTTKNWFFLGVSDLEGFQYKVSDENEKVAFVKEGQLWYYDYSETNLTKVFAFWQDSPTEAKTTYNKHGINIVKFDDAGNLTFTVYGYMNRGRHEGENGIAVYRFMAENSRLEEVLFLSCNEPYDILKEDASKLTYLNEQGEFYYLLGNNVMKINVETKESSYCVPNIPKEYLAVSDDESLLAYPTDAANLNGGSITVLNMETHETKEIAVGESQVIRALGFVDQDLVYGIANREDIILNTDGTEVFPMHTLRIVTLNNEVVKEYSKDNVYVMEAVMGDRVINLYRATKNAGAYVDAPDDFITYKEEQADGVRVNYQYTYDGYNQLYMIFPDDMYVTSIPRLIITKELLHDTADTIVVNSVEKSNRYYVYAKGSMQGSYASPRAAILAANEAGGRALNSDGTCIWKISGLLDYAEVTEGLHTRSCESADKSLETCVRMILDYEQVDAPETLDLSGNPDDILERYLHKSGVNLVACNVDNALYYLCNGAPVIAKLDGETYVVIISYNSHSIRYYNPVLGEEVREERYIIEPKFSEQGNQFFTYVR